MRPSFVDSQAGTIPIARLKRDVRDDLHQSAPSRLGVRLRASSRYSVGWVPANRGPDDRLERDLADIDIFFERRSDHTQQMVADGDVVAGSDRCPLDHSAIDEGAIVAVKVDQNEALGVPMWFRMVTPHVQVVDENVVIRRSPDPGKREIGTMNDARLAQRLPHQYTLGQVISQHRNVWLAYWLMRSMAVVNFRCLAKEGNVVLDPGNRTKEYAIDSVAQTNIARVINQEIGSGGTGVIRPVSTFEIMTRPFSILETELPVLSRYQTVLQWHERIGRAADRHGLSFVKDVRFTPYRDPEP